MKEQQKQSFFRKHGSNVLLVLLIILFIVPQTRKPIQVGLNRLLAFSPTEIKEEKREVLSDYQWNLYTLSGEKATFEEARGEVVVLNFWATWCPPCVAEMPSFQKLYDSYGNKVKFYFVSQEEEEPLKNFLEKRSYDLPVYRSVSRMPEKLVSNSLPTTFVISKSGEIVMHKTGAADWDTPKVHATLEQLLKEE